MKDLDGTTREPNPYNAAAERLHHAVPFRLNKIEPSQGSESQMLGLEFAADPLILILILNLMPMVTLSLDEAPRRTRPDQCGVVGSSVVHECRNTSQREKRTRHARNWPSGASRSQASPKKPLTCRAADAASGACHSRVGIGGKMSPCTTRVRRVQKCSCGSSSPRLHRWNH